MCYLLWLAYLGNASTNARTTAMPWGIMPQARSMEMLRVPGASANEDTLAAGSSPDTRNLWIFQNPANCL
jgi:hypothetical protein